MTRENDKTTAVRRGAFLCAVCLLLVSPLWSLQDARGEIPNLDRVRVLPSPTPIADAELTNHDGEPFQLSTLNGRVAFVFLGFTSCPNVCPLAMQRLKELHDSERLDPADVAYVFISVDGERDTPERMKTFLENYSTGFIGLTGEPGAVRPIASNFSAPFFKGHVDHGGEYQVTHSPQIFLLDRQGGLRAELYNAPLESMVGAANALLEEDN